VRDLDAINPIIATNRLVLVEFYDKGNGACQRLRPVLHEMANALSNQVVFVEVNVKRARPVAERYAVETLPSVMFFRNGQIADRCDGLRKRVYYESVLAELGARLPTPPEKAQKKKKGEAAQAQPTQGEPRK
jgi:thioredoxin-like negative regulator of GroEL